MNTNKIIVLKQKFVFTILLCSLFVLRKKENITLSLKPKNKLSSMFTFPFTAEANYI